jgi:hypothetical protein
VAEARRQPCCVCRWQWTAAAVSVAARRPRRATTVRRALRCRWRIGRMTTRDTGPGTGCSLSRMVLHPQGAMGRRTVRPGQAQQIREMAAHLADLLAKCQQISGMRTHVADLLTMRQHIQEMMGHLTDLLTIGQ